MHLCLTGIKAVQFAAVLLNVPEDLGLLVSGVLGAILLPFWGHGRANRVPA